MRLSGHWKLCLLLFPIIGTCVLASPGGQRGFFQAWWGVASAVTGDPYELLEPTAYWYPSADLNNTDRILGIASTNTVNTATVTTNGWEFNGTSQYLDMGYPDELAPRTNLLYSMAAWVWSPTANDALRGIMGKTFLTGGLRWGIYANSGNGHRAIIGGTAISPATGYLSNTWYHLVMTVDRSQANNFLLYRDGVLEATGSYNVSIDFDYVDVAGGPTTPFRFGSFNNSSGLPAHYWNGYIDQAAVWKGKVLTSNEVFQLFEDTKEDRK